MQRATLGRVLSLLFCAVGLVGCGVATYPGQPGVSTDSYSKIDLEYLDETGLFVYEASYDNRAGGAGVTALITKLYPGARTYTSNVRTNADGTLFRAKAQYDGAQLQMISLPKLNQIYVSPDSKVQFLIDYEDSLDEVDTKNEAEKGIFLGGASFPLLSEAGWERWAQRFSLIRSARPTRNGTLSYKVSQATLGQEVWKPTAPISVETTLLQNALRAELTADQKRELADWLEVKFPKGYRGPVTLRVGDPGTDVTVRLGVHTLKTIEASGVKIIHATTAELERMAAQRGGVR